MKDLTKGKPSTLILSFALPVFLGNLLQLTYSLADTRIVGSFLKEDALAAVGATSPLSGLIIGFLMGLANGFAIVTAQKFGAGNREEVRKSFALSLVMGSVISLILTVLGLLFLHPILRFLNVPDHLTGTARQYIFIIIAGMLATFLYDTCAASLRALGDTVTPLVILAVSVTLNIAGDLFFILVVKAGVQGAAVATVLSQTLAFLICWFYMIRRYEILRLKKKDFFGLERNMMKNMLSAGLSMGLVSSLVNLGTLILQTGINTLGTSVIVAHTAARKVFEIWGLPVTVLGATMATYSGQNYGAGKYDRITSGLKAALMLGCGWAVMVMIMAYTISTCLVGFIASTQNAEILYWGTTYLRVDMLFEMVCVWIVILRNTMQGVGDYKTPIFSSFLELACKIVFTAVFVRYFGYWGVIWTEPVTWIIMVIPLIVMLKKNPVFHQKKTA